MSVELGTILCIEDLNQMSHYFYSLQEGKWTVSQCDRVITLHVGEDSYTDEMKQIKRIIHINSGVINFCHPNNTGTSVAFNVGDECYTIQQLTKNEKIVQLVLTPIE